MNLPSHSVASLACLSRSSTTQISTHLSESGTLSHPLRSLGIDENPDTPGCKVDLKSTLYPVSPITPLFNQV